MRCMDISLAITMAARANMPAELTALPSERLVECRFKRYNPSMFYKATLHLHNLTWWIILFSGLWTTFRVWRGHLAGLTWTRHERLAGLVFSTALATQLLIGLTLYFQSPVVRPLFAGGATTPERLAATFFGLIHPLVMFTAVVLGQAGFSISKRLSDDRRKYRIAVICYTAALAVLLLAVPWPPLSYGRSLLP